MNRRLHRNNNISGKALLLLGVYLLHFTLFQVTVAGFSGHHDLMSKAFVSNSHSNNVPNSGIAIFRTLEKHESPQQTFKVFSDYSITISELFSSALLHDESHDRIQIPSMFQLAETSYRLYVRDCIFRI